MKKAEDTQFPLKKNPKSKTGGSHNFLFFNLLFCNRDIQFSAAFTGRIYGHVGALGWSGLEAGASPFGRHSRKEAQTALPHWFYHSAVRYNQGLAGALLPSPALSLKHISESVLCKPECGLQVTPGQAVCASGCLSCRRTAPKPHTAPGLVRTL